MLLEHLLKDVEMINIIGDKNIDISEIIINSKKATRDCLFICLSGNDYDGHDYVLEAERGGAVALVVNKPVDSRLTQIVVEDTRSAMSYICCNYFCCDKDKIKFIGVVGTNGKTTTAHYIYSILNNAGIKTGLIGTLGVKFNEKYYKTSLTTPDPIHFYEYISMMQQEGITHIVMEVSAHAIYYDKIAGLKFEAGVFTNFSQDHLDFFKDMQTYKSAKLKFFNQYQCKYIVTNSDDKVGLEILKNVGAIGYGIKNPSDVFAIRIKQKINKTTFVMNLFDCVYQVELKMIGVHNVYNALAAGAVCALLGVKTYQVVDGLNKIESVRGRLEQINVNNISVFIDYAHTPDGLEKTLKVLRPLCQKNLICVFGCGGNRDASKRASMGKISGKIADFTVITTDNPRFEEPMDIINQIEKGISDKKGAYIIIQDRKQAIIYALEHANEGDFVLIAGKGGEDYQEILGVKKPYKDIDVVLEYMEKKY